MRDSKVFADEAKAALASLCMKYGLRVRKTSDQEITLIGDLYAIAVWQDRDGVSCMYYDNTQETVHGYNLILFLITKRRERLTFARKHPGGTPDSREPDELQALVRHLGSAADDILSGSRSWLTDYQWPPVVVSEQVRRTLRE